MKAKGCTFRRIDDKNFAIFAENKRYEITRFQRAYTWGSYQIDGVMHDLQYSLESGENIGWPSILLQAQNISEQDGDYTVYDIGDGQQRIITITLALLAIWQKGHIINQQGKISESE